ncbi:MFS transporter [Polymorphum gilvum]|uniref:Major facilitator superfamily (MFS) transporter n=1 Tax=Polymorphum gilvum (strain LMG 25793 / CGMCC 1.9160 / SL003B-26A1) TaxID=991905 RepID=F2J418_POLGS|nr:MFS transporter [Polymorphum gilvum]ADZ69944.1 Major facilitator superfamily (MFS) transporter [Polymorphum gilvum SL003B-26A1]
MRVGIASLLLAYVLSQFYRAFLAVMAPVLQADIGVTADDLADASGLWFLAFALMQLPVGWALDRVGPRLTAAVLLALGGGGGALLFAAAQSPWAISAAMMLIGVGCSPVLMASFYIFARMYSPAVFGTLAGAIIGAGSVGNLASALPMAVAIEAFGWRETVIGLAAITFAVALGLLRFVQDPPRAERRDDDGSMWDILRTPAIWLIVPMLVVNYAPSGGIRGLWAGPYFAEVFDATPEQVGQVTLLMALAMVLGNFLYGPLDRVFGTRKGVVLVGNLAGTACLALLWLFPASGWWTAAALIAGVGLFGSSFPMMMAHGRAFFPPHLVGRGVTLLNLFTIGGVGLFQMLSGRVQVAASAAHGGDPVQTYSVLFGFFALVLGAGCAVYAFSRDRVD